MSVRQYIGARYTTKIYENSLDPSSAEWESGVTYEPLTMVTYLNSSYLSKKEVPGAVGNPAANPTYWVVTGAYNGQILNLQNQIDELKSLYITPEYYGAVGDGVTDDSTAIQAALNNSNGKTVLFNAKTYGISSDISIPANTKIIGSNAIIKCLDTTNMVRMFYASNSDNINISGIAFNFNAPGNMGPTNSHMWMNAPLELVNCDYCVIDNCKSYNLKYHQSGIICQGDHNIIRNCEVYSGSGNRMNSGIITGTWNNPLLASNGGSKYGKIHNCYVHDISTGTSPSESGYGIYTMASTDMEVYNNVVIDCNWVCINGQSEPGLPSCKRISIHDNITVIDSLDVYPRQDYLGPYNIYLEDAGDCEIYDNFMVCGNCTSSRYIPLQISETTGSCCARGNKFVLGSTNNVFSAVGIAGKVIYENNDMDFASANRGIFIFNDPSVELTVRNSTIRAVNDVIYLDKGTQADISGYIQTDGVIASSTNGKFIDSPANLSMFFEVKNTSFTGSAFIVLYNNNNDTVENCDINCNGNLETIQIRYGVGSKTIKNNKIRSAHGPIRIWPTTGSPFPLIDIEGNDISTSMQVFNIGTVTPNITELVISNNKMNRPGTGSTVSLNGTIDKLFLTDSIITCADTPVASSASISKGIVSDNSVIGAATIGVTTTSTLIVENNHCLA